MDYRLMIRIGGVEIFEDGSQAVGMPSITGVSLKQSTALSALQFGSTASDCLYLTMLNPYKNSFEGDVIDFYISPQSDTSLDDNGITEKVGSGMADSAIDTVEMYDVSIDEEEGEPLTAEEEAELEEYEEATTNNMYDFINGEPVTEAVEHEEIVENEWIYMGRFYVYRQTYSDENKSCKIEALDGMCRLLDTYVPSFTKGTPQDFYNDLRGQILASTGIVIDDFQFDDVYNSEIEWGFSTTYRNAFGYLAGLIGGYATFSGSDKGSISFYTFEDSILLDSNVIAYQETSMGETIMEGIQCDISRNAYTNNFISAGSGASIVFANPFVTEEILEEIFKPYDGLRFSGASANILWNHTIQSGEFIRIQTADEYENYIALNNSLEVATDQDEVLRLKREINSLGRIIHVTNQTIDFTGHATSKITSVTDSNVPKPVSAWNIGGWEIGENCIYKGKTIISPNGIIIEEGKRFPIEIGKDDDGTVSAQYYAYGNHGRIGDIYYYSYGNIGQIKAGIDSRDVLLRITDEPGNTRILTVTCGFTPSANFTGNIAVNVGYMTGNTFNVMAQHQQFANANSNRYGAITLTCILPKGDYDFRINPTAHGACNVTCVYRTMLISI